MWSWTVLVGEHVQNPMMTDALGFETIVCQDPCRWGRTGAIREFVLCMEGVRLTTHVW